MKWGICECCSLDGHCENQDRGHKCETYPKQLEDKVERLEEQLKEANEIISDLSEYPPINPSTRELSNALNRYNAKNYLEKWGVK